MKVVFSSPNFPVVAHYRTILESRGIPCHLRNEYLAGAAGELPPLDCWPELCVGDRWEQQARAVIAEAAQPAEPGAAWDCPGCGERLEGQFTACWNCGHEA